MADYRAILRSNRFAVRDPSALRAWAETRPDMIVEIDDDHAVIACPDKGAAYDLPNNAGTGTEDVADALEPVDYISDIGPHVAPGAVAVILEIGSEKLRYVAGMAFAIYGGQTPQDYRIVTLSLDDIYGLAAETFDVPESAIACAES